MRSQKPFCEKEIADSAKILSEEDEIPSFIVDLSVLSTLQWYFIAAVYYSIGFSVSHIIELFPCQFDDIFQKKVAFSQSECLRKNLAKSIFLLNCKIDFTKYFSSASCNFAI